MNWGWEDLIQPISDSPGLRTLSKGLFIYCSPETLSPLYLPGAFGAAGKPLLLNGWAESWNVHLQYCGSSNSALESDISYRHYAELENCGKIVPQKDWHNDHSVQFSCSVVSDSLGPYELQHVRPPCPSPTPRVHSNSCPLSWWCHPAKSSSVIPFSSCPQSLPASESFPTFT